MTDFKKILDKAKELETSMREKQEKIKKIEAEGISGGNKIKITLNGEGEIKKIEMSDDLLNENKSVIADLIIAAHNNAKANLKVKTNEEISKISSDIGIPGFKWPL